MTNVTGYAAAVADAKRLAAQHEGANVVLVLDDRGRVLDRKVFAGHGHTHESALSWADCALYNFEAFAQMVLLSAGDASAVELRERDIETFRLARRIFGEVGVIFLDWIKTDGETVLSLAKTVDPEGAWAA